MNYTWMDSIRVIHRLDRYPVGFAVPDADQQRGFPDRAAPSSQLLTFVNVYVHMRPEKYTDFTNCQQQIENLLFQIETIDPAFFLDNYFSEWWNRGWGDCLCSRYSLT